MLADVVGDAGCLSDDGEESGDSAGPCPDAMEDGQMAERSPAHKLAGDGNHFPERPVDVLGVDQEQKLFHDCFVASIGGPATGDGESVVAVVGQQFFKDASIQSREAAAKATNVHPERYKKLTALLAELTIVAERWGRSLLERSVTLGVPRVDVCLYVEVCSWDETPLAIKTKGTKAVATQQQDVAGAATCAAPRACGTADRTSDRFLAKDSTKSKIMQTQTAYAMLIRIGARELLIRSQTLNWVQVLERSTAEVLCKALEWTGGPSPAADDFTTKVRVAIADKASENDRCEQGIASRRGAQWQSIRIFCHVHVCSTAHNKCFGIVDQTTSGAIHYSLVLGMSAEMRGFRKALRGVIVARLRILHGCSSQSATQYLAACISAFCCVGTHQRAKTTVLTQLCNGDWRNRGVIEHYVQPGVEITTEVRDALVDEFLNHFVWAAAGRGPATYPKSRWTGAEHAFADIALLDCIHGVGSAAMTEWLRSKACAASSAEPRHDAQEALTDQVSGASGAQDAGATQGFGAGAVAQTSEGATFGDLSWAQQNAEHRKRTADFIQTGAIRTVPLLFVVCGPLARLLERYMAMGGIRWETLQRKAATERSNESGLKRTYPLVEAASMSLEVKLFGKVQLLLDKPEPWEVVHPDLRAVSSSALATRLLLRASTSVFQLLAVPHDGFPYRLFSVLKDASRATDLSAAPACMLDNFSAAFLARFKGPDGVASSEASAELLALASATRLDISNIEVGHSRLRRRILAASNNTHVVAAEDASAAWVASEARRRRTEADKAAGRLRLGAAVKRHKRLPKHQTAAGGANAGHIGQAKKTARGRRGGGPYRAFLRLHWHEDRDYGSLSEKYKHISEEERQLCIELGRQMTEAARSAEGPRMSLKRRVDRQVQKDVKRLRLQEHSQAAASSGASHNPGRDLLQQAIIACSAQALPESLAVARQQDAAASAHRRTNDESLRSELQAHATAQEQRLAEDLGRISTFWRSSTGNNQSGIADLDTCDILLSSREHASRVLAYLQEHPRKHHHIFETFGKDWERRHAMLHHDAAKKLDGGRKSGVSKCWALCFCTCTQTGKQTKAMRVSWSLHALNRCCRPLSEGRRLVSDGHFLCRIESYDAQEVADDCDIEPVSQFWHVSLMYWSPIRPTFTLAELLNEDAETGLVTLKATTSHMTDYNAFARLSKGRCWETTWYIIEASPAPLPTVSPGVFRAKPWETEGTRRFWPAETPPEGARQEAAEPRSGGRPRAGRGQCGRARPCRCAKR